MDEIKTILSVIMWTQIVSVCVQLITFVRKVANDAHLNGVLEAACDDDDDIDESERWKHV